MTTLGRAIGDGSAFAAAARGEAPLPDLARMNGHEYGSAADYMTRNRFIGKFSFAVPGLAAIEALASLRAPLIEFGAGTGLWAALLARTGVDIVAVDRRTNAETSTYGQKIGAWHPVLRVGTAGGLRLMADERRTPLLIWPSYMSPLASSVAAAVEPGGRLAYIGEGVGGCTGDQRFHRILDAKFKQLRLVAIPRWPGLHDYFTIWRRR